MMSFVGRSRTWAYRWSAYLGTAFDSAPARTIVVVVLASYAGQGSDAVDGSPVRANALHAAIISAESRA